jgi:3-oxoadipate enol-lactonase
VALSRILEEDLIQQQVNGITLAYDVEGAGPWLALCHSLGMVRQMWFQQVPAFSSRYRVLTYDARGHGESTKAPAPYSFDLLADDLYALLQSQGVTSLALIGLSLGGNTAQAFAAAHPEMVKALVLSDTTAWYGPDAPKNWEARAKDVQEKGMAGITDFQVTRWFTEPFVAEHPEIAQQFSQWLVANDPDAYIATQRALGDGDLREAVKRITCPTLIVVGETDYATPPAMAEDLHQRIAGSETMILDRARHLSPVEAADRFNAAVLAFFERVGYGASRS